MIRGQKLLSDKDARRLRAATDVVGVTASPWRLAHQADVLAGDLLRQVRAEGASPRGRKVNRVWARAVKRAKRRRTAAEATRAR